MDQRLEFVRLALLEGANRRQLCGRFGVSPETGYKWLRRYAEGAFAELSRCPHHSPLRATAETERAVLGVRDAHPAWGARKIAAVLLRQGHEPPAVSTVHAILARHGRIAPRPGASPATSRFERARPNELWQMDFKGWSRLGNGGRLHPLTIIDDHSRFAVGLEALTDQTGETVKTRLERIFCHHGLPEAFFVDNGNPWGDSHGARWTRFAVWLLKLGVIVIHSRPYHPQGRGKNERFHRSIDDEVMAFRPLADETQAQRAFDHWRGVYNFERPHEALGMATPASRYSPSPRSMPGKLPQVEYPATDIVRRTAKGKSYVMFKGRNWKIPEAFSGETLAIRPTATDGLYAIHFASHLIATLDLNTPKSVNHVPEHPSAMCPE